MTDLTCMIDVQLKIVMKNLSSFIMMNISPS